jgi:hypothetical protein
MNILDLTAPVLLVGVPLATLFFSWYGWARHLGGDEESAY